MITVRFPTGFSVQYNSATTVEYGTDAKWTILYDRPGGNQIATIVGPCLIERTAPCRTYNPVADTTLRELREEIRELAAKVQRKLKAK